MSPTGAVRTNAPSRMIVTRWQMAKTSSSRCEMNSTAAPCARSVRITSNSRSTSTVVSAAVGSSITSTLASKRERLGDLDDLLVGDRQAAGRPVRVERNAEPGEDLGRGSRFIAAPVDRGGPGRSGCRPMKMFSATVRSGNSVGSW